MKPQVTRARLGALAAATVVAVSANSRSFAADYFWQTAGAGTTDNWSTAGTDANWFIDAGTTLSPWADGNAAIFAGAAGENIVLAGTVAPASTTVNDDGTWTLGGTGVLGGTGTLTKNGTGTLTLSNTSANTFSGGTSITGGTLAIGTGGTGANTSTVGALGTGAVSITGGSTLKLWIQNSTAFTIANAISVDGGNILNEDGNHTLTGPIAIEADGATLRAKWSGKNLTATGILSGTGAVTVARSADGGGHSNPSVILTNSNTYSGGTTVNSAQLQLGNDIAADKGGTGIIRGTLSVNSPGAVILGTTNALGYFVGEKVDTFNINGATVNHTADGDNGWGVSYNMTGGTLQTTGAGRFSFGGGTSVNTAASVNASAINGSVWMRNGNTDNTVVTTVADGDAVYDLALNANVTIGSGGDGVGFTKEGPGTMLINGAGNTYTGVTAVNEGTLALGPAGTLATSPVTVAGGATFRTETGGKTLASLSAAEDSVLGLVAAAGTTTTVTGALDLAGGTITVAPLLGAGVAGGTFDLITAGSITGSGIPAVSFSDSFGISRATGSVAVNGNKLQLTLTGTGADLVWNNASANGTWDLNASANFDNGGSNDVFMAYDAVTFNDSLAPGSAKTVNVAGAVAPSLLTAANSNGNYTLNAATAGGGTLVGVGSLVKTGTAEFILGGNLIYGMAGEVSVAGGTLNLGGKTLPSQTNFTLTGGTLSNGTLPVAGSSDLRAGTVSGALTGPGTFAKSTAGTVILTGASNIAGGGVISAGNLQVGNGGTTGTLGAGPVEIQAGGTLTFFRSDNPFAAVANALSGEGAVAFNGTGTSLQSSYTISGNNSGFSGTITATNCRVGIDNANDTGTAALSTGTNGQFWVTGGTISNPMTIAGNGWLETGGPFGAIRAANNSTISGPITLAGASRISTQGSSATISGNIGQSGGAQNLELGGPGTATNLTLSGTNTYTGTTTLNNASINLTGSLGATAVTVNENSTLRGNGSIGGTVTFAAGATNLGVDLALPGVLDVTGAATFNGTTTVALTPGAGVTPGGSITLLNYGSTNATPANFALANPGDFRQAVFNVGATALTLDIGSESITWTGTGGLTWDIATTSNWEDGAASPGPYYQGDQVVFTDAAGAANAEVTVTDALTPATVTVNNSAAVPYAFTGAGSVGGGTSLLKQGDGTLTVSMAMPYTGGTTVDGGTMIVDGSQNFNRQGNNNLVTVDNGATFEVRGVNALPDAANPVSVTINAGGTLRVVTGTSAANTGGSHAHLGNVTLNGATVDLTHSSSGGTAYNGESFQLNGTVTVGGSAPSVIQTGTLDTTVQGIALQGSRTFAIADATGSAASDLIVSAELENHDGNNGALVKTGPGTLELAAANSYSAGTTVEEGVLVVSNGLDGSATGTGPVTIAAGTTLTGEGTASGAVTAEGTLAPGASAGMLRTGSLVLTGTYACEIDGAVSDLLEITGDIDLTGATLDVTQLSPATEQSYVIGSWTGTRTGSFATVAGVPAGLSVVYDNANKLILLGEATGYSEWIGGFPGLSDTSPGADPDLDGFANLLEYILGGDPGTGSQAIAPTQAVTPATVEFSFTRSDDSEGDTTQIVQWSDDLVEWNDIPIPAASEGSVTVVENGAADDDVTVSIPRAANTKMFVRLQGNQ